MNNRIFFLVILFFLNYCFTKAQTQLEGDTNVIRELKSFKKNLHEYKALKALDAQLSEEIRKRTNAIDLSKDMFDSIANVDETINLLLDSLQRVQKFVFQRFKKNNSEAVFRIQIGVFRNHPIDRFASLKPNFFAIESNGTVLKKYMLGNFKRFEEAQKFSDYLKKLGVKSYIVGYLKGRRVKDLRLIN